MRWYLPKVGTKLYYQILLPQNLGGLNLYFDDDLVDLIKVLPPPTAAVLYALSKGEDVESDLRILRKFISNPSIRGYSFSELTKDTAERLISEVVPSETLKQVVSDLQGQKKLLPNDPNLILTLERLGWYTLDSAIAELIRGYLFRDILSGDNGNVAYNTMSWKTRYSIIWDRIYRGEPKGFTPTPEELKKLFRSTQPTRVFNLGLVNVIDYDRRDGVHIHIEMSIKDELSEFLPTLRIPRSLIGTRIDFHQ